MYYILFPCQKQWQNQLTSVIKFAIKHRVGNILHNLVKEQAFFGGKTLSYKNIYIKIFKKAKRVGSDDITAEHLIYSHTILIVKPQRK